MKAKSLVRKINQLGGTAEIISEERTGHNDKKRMYHKVLGTLNGYDVEMIDLDSSFYTIRRISQRGAYDPGSDYNPGGWIFCHRLNELQYYAAEQITA
jgi:hypothetical protein